MELLKYVYLYALKSIIKAGNNKFQDLINAPRKSRYMLVGHDITLLYLPSWNILSSNKRNIRLFHPKNVVVFLQS